MSRVNLFVPSYAALTLSVWYISIISWYNSAADKLLVALQGSGILTSVAKLPHYEPSWKNGAVILAFFFLSAASTTFLAAPSRPRVFSRDQWKWELQQPELLYLHASWSKRYARLACLVSLFLGGAISLFLLGSTVVQHIVFILSHV